MTREEIDEAVRLARECGGVARDTMPRGWLTDDVHYLARAVLALDERVRVATQLCDAAMRRAEAAEARVKEEGTP